MLTMPAIGAWADLHAAKKRVLAGRHRRLRALHRGAGAARRRPGSGRAGHGRWSSSPTPSIRYGEIADRAPSCRSSRRPRRMGKVSGWGWAFGYFGGMLALGLCLAYVIWAQAPGPAGRAFRAGHDADHGRALRRWPPAPTFALLRERAPAADSATTSAAPGSSCASTFREARALPRLHVAACVHGLLPGRRGGGDHAGRDLRRAGDRLQARSETMVLIFVLNIAAAIGAFGFGYLQDRIGHGVRSPARWWAGSRLRDRGLGHDQGRLLVGRHDRGPGMGSSQSAGRAMAGILAPPRQLAEFFGLWTFATRLASIIGPLSYGAITWATGGNQRIAILVDHGLFVAGLLLLLPIDMRRGREAALGDERELSLDGIRGCLHHCLRQ